MGPIKQLDDNGQKKKRESKMARSRRRQLPPLKYNIALMSHPPTREKRLRLTYSVESIPTGVVEGVNIDLVFCNISHSRPTVFEHLPRCFRRCRLVRILVERQMTVIGSSLSRLVQACPAVLGIHGWRHLSLEIGSRRPRPKTSSGI